LCGFYVAGEFALVAVDRTRIESMADDGHKGARGVAAALKTLSFQLSGAQLGITITSLLIGFILEPTLGQALRSLFDNFMSPSLASKVAVGVALALATATTMILGELVPKNLAIARPLNVAFGVTPPLRANNALFKPLIVMLNNAANFTVRLIGIEPTDELKGTRSLEELEVLIQSSREGGTIRETEYSLLTRSISFGGKTAGDALVPRTAMLTLRADETIPDLMEEALGSGHSRFPVTGEDNDDILGIANLKDCYQVPPELRASTKLSEIAQEALVVPESRDLKSLLVEMRRLRKQIVVVIDEFGSTAGIITIEDLVEEIVGEIEDEHDLTYLTPAAEERRSGVNVVDGMLRPDELRDATGLELPDGDYDTLAGFLLTLFDRIPRRGDHCSYREWEFKVTDMDRNRIAKVLVVAPPREPEEGDR
jgi:CBS domain containing-hemolysin-like protein